ncbi:MAG: hypothetical protein ACE5FW_01820 [Candidatus Aenigmatarchaeota archaeon]
MPKLRVEAPTVIQYVQTPLEIALEEALYNGGIALGQPFLDVGFAPLRIVRNTETNGCRLFYKRTHKDVLRYRSLRNRDEVDLDRVKAILDNDTSYVEEVSLADLGLAHDKSGTNWYKFRPCRITEGCAHLLRIPEHDLYVKYSLDEIHELLPSSYRKESPRKIVPGDGEIALVPDSVVALLTDIAGYISMRE